MKRIDINTTPEEEIIAAACETLAAGGLVVYPTETTYGIGVDATNQQAVDKLLRYKSRREGKPLSIAVPDREMATRYVTLTEQAENLYQNFLPGPITVVSRVKEEAGDGGLAAGVASERKTVGVRMPDYPLIRKIVAAYGKPITATSANASYKKRPYAISDILYNISDKQKELINLILDAGELPRNEPSTVVDTTLEQPTVLRQGDIKLTKATTLTTKNEDETRELGARLTRQYRHYLNEKALIFALVGEMGAGKTQLTKGIAAELGITQPVTSPTFTIAREYRFSTPESNNKFVHIDTWRLPEEEELESIGFTEMVDSMSVMAIEWADKYTETLQQHSAEAKIIWVKLASGATENERVITYSDSLESE